MYSVQHHGIPHPPINPRIQFSSLGWTGIQWRSGDQNQCKTPSQVHPDHIIPQQESDPKACTARNAFAGPTFCTAWLQCSTMESEKLENQSSSTHPPTSRSLEEGGLCGTWSCPWWSSFPSLPVDIGDSGCDSHESCRS
jgi:hypothetical protein